MKTNYSKMYDKKNVSEKEPVEVTQKGLKIDDVVETEVTPDKVIEKTVGDVIIESNNIKKETVKTPFMAEVIGSLNLNVRKKPNGEVFTSIVPGAQIKVLDISEDNEWYQIESPKGFVMKKFTKKVK